MQPRYFVVIAVARLRLHDPALAARRWYSRRQPRLQRASADPVQLLWQLRDRMSGEIYASSLPYAGASTELIDGFSFRAYPGAAPSFFFGNSVDISDVVIKLSTTAGRRSTMKAGPLPSATFADNPRERCEKRLSGCAGSFRLPRPEPGRSPSTTPSAFRSPSCTIQPMAICCSTRDDTFRSDGKRRWISVFSHSTPSIRSR